MLRSEATRDRFTGVAISYPVVTLRPKTCRRLRCAEDVLRLRSGEHSVNWSRLSTILSFTIAIVGAHSASAQQADMIRGRVTARDGGAIDKARVTVTSIPNNVSKNTATDKDG